MQFVPNSHRQLKHFLASVLVMLYSLIQALFAQNNLIDYWPVLYVDTAIKGLTVGVATMKRHEVSVIRCRADYAYGQAGKSPQIPPNATLVFEVELLDFFGKQARI